MKDKIPVYLLDDFPEDIKYDIKVNGAEYKVLARGEEITSGLFSTGAIEGEYNNWKIYEQSLIAITSKGPVLITGCSHPGIVKIVNQATELANDKLHLLLGGFHLLHKSTEEIEKTIDQMKPLVEKIAPCHCTGDGAIELFEERFKKNFIPVGVGTTIVI